MEPGKIEAIPVVVAGTLMLVGAAIGAWQARKDDPVCGAFFGAIAAPFAAFAALMVAAVLFIYFRCLWLLLS